MQDQKFVSLFPSNVNHYLHNLVFDSQKNKGVEAKVFITLKQYLKKKNIIINTYDIDTEKEPFKYVYIDMPHPWRLDVWKKIILNRGKNTFICNEPQLVNILNYWKPLHFFFKKIYTWYDPLVDNRKYFKILLPKSSLGIKTKPKNFKEKKFLVLINKNMLPFYPFQLLNSQGRELYSERIKSIEFFEEKIPNKFYLYGRGWNKPKKYNLTEKIFGFRKYITYKGEVDDKIELLSNFKFSICFENLTGVNGWITEKIFDCFKARCVPIYWGATDIKKYIPKECFIDFRRFRDYDELLIFLNSIDEEKYSRYVRSIDKLLSDKKFINLWFEDQFASFFLEDILEIQNE